jgi:nitronate monooxygenase
MSGVRRDETARAPRITPELIDFHVRRAHELRAEAFKSLCRRIMARLRIPTATGRDCMPLQTILTQRLGMTHPIIQAPLAGGGDTPALVAAVCEAGALGYIGAAYLTPAQIAEAARAVRARTSRPFGINLFVPARPPAASDPGPALRRLAPMHAELGLAPPAVPASAAESFDAQLTAALDSGASVFSFTFGLLPASAMEAVKKRGLTVIGTATTVDEALALEAAGVDAVVAQGSEAGGHRGTFAFDFADAMIGTMALVPQMVDAVRVPVIASGGVMDGRGIAAALALGAGAVQMGTAFLTCTEAGIAEAYKRAILAAREHQTRITRAFSGRPARGIVNRFMTEVERDAADAILPFPWQNALTRPLRSAAARQGRAEFLSLWAGQGLRLARRQSAADLVARLADETAAALRRLAP